MIIEDHTLSVLRLQHSASIGYTSGVFDLFHYGHKNYISACRLQCDILVIGVDSDELVSRRKGCARPSQPAAVRAANVARHNNCYVFIKNSASESYTNKLLPEIYFFSEENAPAREKLERISKSKNFKKIITIPYTNSISTTALLQVRDHASVNCECGSKLG